MTQNLKEMDSTDWIEDKKKGTMSMKYKFPEGTETVSLLMEAIVDAPACNILAMCREVELYSKYVPFCDKAFTVKKFSEFSEVSTSIMYFPIIPNREAIYSAEGIDRLNVNGTILL